jgi:high-affinity iron transporter
LPSSKTEMATIGPIVRNEVFFFIVILGAAALVVLREWFGTKAPVAEQAANAAERRKLQWEFRRRRAWSFAAASLCLLVVLALTAEFVYARSVNAPVQATALVAQNGEVRISLSQLMDSSLHYYTAEVNQADIRFVVIHKSGGDYATALDACQICGAVGYRQEGQNVICRNCGAAIYIPSIGQSGGCNPIAVKSRVEKGEVVVDLSALMDAASTIHAK